MYNIDNTNNIGNMGHLTKEQFTWQFWNMAGITMYLQLPFNSSSHLFYLHDLWESQTYMASCMDWGFKGGGGVGFYTCVFSWFSEPEERKMKIIRIKAGLENLQIQFTGKNCKMHALIDPFTPKISIVILLTVCYTILVMLVWRIWSWIN